MTPALLDVNVLLALAWPNHQHHQAAHAWFHAESRHGWTTCALTQVAFVRLSSNPAYTPEAVPPRDGAALLARFTAHKHHRFWRELPALATTMLLRASGHQQVMDAYLVALARHHKGRVVTLDGRLAAHATNTGDVTVITMSGP